MKRLLMLAYHFPPHGGGGVLRTVETLRGLADLGWRTTVVAGSESGYWLEDASLAGRVPSSIEVRRAGGLTGPGILRVLRKSAGGGEQRNESAVRFWRCFTDWLPVPDVYCGWIPGAVRAGLGPARAADWIMSTSPPESAHLAAWYLARRTGCPWVADFRDPWVRGIYRRYPTALQRACQERFERLTVSRASLVLATSESAVEDFRSRYPKLPPERFQFIPNGFDSREFSHFQNNPSYSLPLKIIHAGNLTLDRDIAPLLEAISRINKSRLVSQPAIRLELAGLYGPELKALAERSGAGAAVEFSGNLPRGEILARLARAHLGLLVESYCPAAGLVVPGKLYDYLGAGLPVLALVPPGAAAMTVARTAGGLVLTEPDSRRIEKALRVMLERLSQGQRPLDPPDRAASAGFERALLVEKLACLLEPMS